MPDTTPGYAIGDLAFPIALAQDARGRFTVTYGAQVTRDLDYYRACTELGAAILHALTLDGRIAGDS